MTLPSDPRARADLTRTLAQLRSDVQGVEDDLLSCLVIMGEPEAQREVDGWVDHLVDVLRAVSDVADQHLATLQRTGLRRDDHHEVHHDAPQDAYASRVRSARGRS